MLGMIVASPVQKAKGKMKGNKEDQRFEMGSVQRDIKQNSTFQHRKKRVCGL